MSFEEFPKNGQNSQHGLPPEDIAWKNLMEDFGLHLKRTLKHDHIDIGAFSKHPDLVHYDQVKPEWIKQYFVNRSGFFDGKEGRHRMIAWRILVALLLHIDDPHRRDVERIAVENVLKKIEVHRSLFNRIPFFHGTVLCIAGSSTLDEDVRTPWRRQLNILREREREIRTRLDIAMDSIDQSQVTSNESRRLTGELAHVQEEIGKKEKELATVDMYEKAYGHHRFFVTPVQKMFRDQVGKNISAFILKRLQKFNTKEENETQKKDLLQQIATLDSPATFIFNGHGTSDRFFFHDPSESDGFSVGELVDAFMKRAKKTRHLPIGLMHAEYGQKVVGLHYLDFYRDILRVDKGGATIGELLEADKKRMGLNNFVLYVPSMFSPENDSRNIRYDLVDRIIFSQCNSMDFAVSFYQELQRRLGGKEHYLPITKRKDRRRERWEGTEKGVV